MPHSRPDLCAEITDRIISALESGTALMVCPWDRTGWCPRTGISGRTYRGLNTALLAISGYGDPRWCTYGLQARPGGRRLSS